MSSLVKEQPFDLSRAFASHYETWRFVMSEYVPRATEVEAAALGIELKASKHVFLDFVCRTVMAIIKGERGFSPEKVATFVTESSYFDRLLVRYSIFGPMDFTRLCERACRSWTQTSSFKYEKRYALDIEKNVFGDAIEWRYYLNRQSPQAISEMKSNAVAVRDVMVAKARKVAGLPPL